jgi:small subunit ribosomal protein S16
MLTIRMQRTGRKGHAQFRVVVQDSRVTPTSGKVVAALGSYDPHAKTSTLNKEKAAFYLEHGAQPSPRAVRLLQSEGVKLPEWVKVASTKDGVVRNADKRRSTTPKAPEEPAAEVVETPEVDEATAEEVVADATAEDAPSEAPSEATSEA